MRKLLVALLVTSFALPSVNGEGTTPRGRMVAVPSSPKPVEEAAPPKPSFFKRFFCPLPTPTPIPRPTPTPTPAPIVKKRTRPKAKPAETAEPTEPAVAPAKTPAPAPTKPKTAAGRAKTASPTASGMDDPAKFKAAKAKAMEDPAIKDLKSKADGEVDEAEAQKALVNFNRALFRKIREIDSSVSDYAERVEQSMTKRLGSEKGKE